MLEIQEIAATDHRRIDEFIGFPFQLYRHAAQWIPPFRAEMRSILMRRHPFFEHSEAAFFLARRGGRVVGRITAFENRRFNDFRDRKEARFHHFECAEDGQAAAALLEAALSWASRRGLEEMVGPYGLSHMDGGGVLIEGFEHRGSMTMMPYHLPYYGRLIEQNGFVKARDQFTAVVDRHAFRTPEKIERVARIHYERGHFRVPVFRSKRALLGIAGQIGDVYNRAFAAHEDFCPLQDQEIDRLASELILVSKPSLIKVLYYDEKVVGFLFAFPDLSGALQRARGRLGPLRLVDLLTEARRTDTLIVNGAAILPEYQKLGGNGLLYYELIRAIQDSRYTRAEMVQIADTTTLMLADMKTLGGRVYKIHRIYRRAL
jgi:GNAT superfamily N-acetyltransferase